MRRYIGEWEKIFVEYSCEKGLILRPYIKYNKRTNNPPINWQMNWSESYQVKQELSMNTWKMSKILCNKANANLNYIEILSHSSENDYHEEDETGPWERDQGQRAIDALEST